jgi:DNA replication and repair protein RecF
MRLDRLELINYRNYDRTIFDFSPQLNLIIGGNAQGKTNVLEAVYFLSAGNSHRISSASQLIKQGEMSSAIRSKITKDNGPITLEVMLSPSEKKRVKVGGVEKRRFSDLLGHLHAVIFSPEDLQLVKGGPERRRSFLDDTVVQIYPPHDYWRRRYERVLRQRNILLKSRSQGVDDGSLELWDKNLVEAGTKLVVGRLTVLNKLDKFATQAHLQITNQTETLRIDYLSRVTSGGVEGPREIGGKFHKELVKRRKDELDRKITLVGPHRDDLTLTVNGADVRLYGSQGQQRTVALALKLGQFRLIEEEVKERPLLLLDDVMSELDDDRRSFLVETIRSGTQVFITATTRDSIADQHIGDCKVIRIKDGKLIDEG